MGTPGRDKCFKLVRGIKVTCEAATPWVEKQQTTEPHALQSSEQVCLRVWGWMRCGVGQGGAVVPSNPFPVPSAILWKPSHFVCNCPARAPGLNVRLV